ncbi:MAG: YfhO family protein [Bacteroidales bacterium]|nr:YfhO family protein [Bacteroidales bacterium]
MNQFYPSRYFTTNCIRNGICPLWNPYQSMGTPVDPQSGVFYLPMWVFAVFGEYSRVTCGLDFIFHAFMGVCGFYLLAYRFTDNRLASFVTACAYALSGFYIGNAQHLAWIVSAAWLPWVTNSFIGLFENPNWKSALLFPLLLSLMISGGYPGASFILVYLLLVVAVFYLVRLLHSRDWNYGRRLLRFGAFSFFIALLLCAPTLMSFWELKSQITRGAELTCDQTGVPFTVQGVISLVFPYVSVSTPEFIQTDISMANIYFGFWLVPFAIYGLFKNRDKVVWGVFAFGLFSFLMSLGTKFPLFCFFFQHFPLINFVRIPALFRVFFILTVLLLAAIGLKMVLEDFLNHKRQLLIGLSVVLFSFILFIVVTAILSNGSLLWQNWREGTLLQKCFVESAILAIEGLMCLVFLLLIKNKNWMISCAILILVADLICQTNLCGPKTIYDTTKDKTEMAKAQSVKGYPIPTKTMNCSEIAQKHEAWAFWQNLGPFFKEVEWYSLNPVKLYANNKMLKLYHDHVQTLSIPVLFCPSAVIYDTNSHWLNKDTAYTTNKQMSGLYRQPVDCSLSCFEPGHIIASVKSNAPRRVVLAQNYYKGWSAKLDGNTDISLTPINFSMISFAVPAGEHQVELRYRRPFLMALFVLQAIGSIACLVINCLPNKKKRLSFVD